MDKNKKKVLFVITKGNFGGAQRYVFDLATHLPSDKYEVAVACGEGDALKTKLASENIRVLDLKSSQRDVNILKDIRSFFDIIKIIKSERPDILHLNSSKIGALGAVAGRLNGVKKIIFTAHGWAFNENRASHQKFLIYLIHWITIILSHSTIAVSEQTARDINWLPFLKNKISIIHNGLSPFKVVTKKEASEVLQKTDKNQILIFSIAELHYNKGVDLAIKAISQLPDEYKEKVTYYIAGEGEERRHLEELVMEYNLESQVHFLGFTENAKKLLPGSDIFLSPSRTENLPFAILEAGLVGLPIIATSVGGVPEIITDMENGILVPPRNPKEIAEAIMHLLDHKEKRKELGTKIKEVVLNKFSLEKMLFSTLEMYHS